MPETQPLGLLLKLTTASVAEPQALAEGLMELLPQLLGLQEPVEEEQCVTEVVAEAHMLKLVLPDLQAEPEEQPLWLMELVGQALRVLLRVTLPLWVRLPEGDPEELLLTCACTPCSSREGSRSSSRRARINRGPELCMMENGRGKPSPWIL